MISFKNPRKSTTTSTSNKSTTTKKFSLDKAPYLDSVESMDVTLYVSEHAEFSRYVHAYNQATNGKKIPEISFLGQISTAIKNQILDELLPSTVPVLQDFYPADRIFWDAAKPLKEVTLRAEEKALSLLRS